MSGSAEDILGVLGDAWERMLARFGVAKAKRSVWVGFWLSAEQAAALAIPGGEDPKELHLTLCMLGDADQLGAAAVETARLIAKSVAAGADPIGGTVNGIGVFRGLDGLDALYASYDSPPIAWFRQTLADALDNSGCLPLANHGFVPHITLAFLDSGSPLAEVMAEAVDLAADSVPMTFGQLAFRVGDQMELFPMRNVITAPAVKNIAGEVGTMELSDRAGRLMKTKTISGLSEASFREFVKNVLGQEEFSALPVEHQRLIKAAEAELEAAGSPPPFPGGVAVFNARREGQIAKIREDRRQVFGWASVSIAKGADQPLVDWHKDMIEPADLENAAYEFVLEFRETGEMHYGTAKGRLIESIVFTKEKIAALGLPESALPVGWWVGFQVDDDEAWAKVKSGVYKMFSIQGTALREEVK